MDVSYLLNDLNDAQRKAVTAPAANQLILAGAGSGKTRVLVHRIAWLIQVENVSPYSIMSVTFTNKAAREMRGRLETLLEGAVVGSTRSMWVGTFHGIAHRLLKAHWKDVGLPQNFQILDSDDQLRLVKRVYQTLQLDENCWPPRQAQWYINAQKDEGLRPQYIQATGDPYEVTMLQVYTAYEEVCRQGGLVDFGELLLRAHELFLDNNAVLNHYQQRFPFILVDEFQDTNTIQYAWLRVLAGANGCVSVVGDDDQSIYGWRGAKIENIQRFSEDFNNTQTIRLEQNYRSTGLILKAANAVIENNYSRLGKELWTEGDEGEPIGLYAAFNEHDESRFIVESIQQWVNEGNNYHSSAILYRSNAQSRVLEEALLREGIAYRIYGGQRFYDRLEIKNALSYLRLIINHHDDTAFERIINTPIRGIGGKTVEKIRLFAREHGCSSWQAANTMLTEKILAPRAASAVALFFQLIGQLTRAIEGQELADQVDIVIKQSGLLLFHKNEKGEKGQARVENLEELVNACRAFDPDNVATQTDTDNKPPLLEQFLDSASLDAGDTQADEFDDAVQLMTLHSAKGLEFARVFMAGVEENLFPHKMSAEDPERLEEERRLCYVGITRAMEKLTISYAETRRMHGTESYNRMSRFIKEIPHHCISEIRLKTQVQRPLGYQQVSRKKPALHDESIDIGHHLGQRVSHPMFGDGIIVHFESQGNNPRVQVNFDSEGSKWLVLKYANLQAI
ncbi:DNA helicase II [Candidatus Endobugula sertula]|uniref:DNA 3'-5' helicase n=1 Tax=Candidatus Endobugula sertula TaxID=62101 RepID=A0A1D2QNL1_9GAMM|nr:DNA helicase II [Candidatus Endobugula sertula]